MRRGSCNPVASETDRRHRLDRNDETQTARNTDKLALSNFSAPVAQRIEHPPPKRGADSSILSGRTIRDSATGTGIGYRQISEFPMKRTERHHLKDNELAHSRPPVTWSKKKRRPSAALSPSSPCSCRHRLHAWPATSRAALTAARRSHGGQRGAGGPPPAPGTRAPGLRFQHAKEIRPRSRSSSRRGPVSLERGGDLRALPRGGDSDGAWQHAGAAAGLSAGRSIKEARACTRRWPAWAWPTRRRGAASSIRRSARTRHSPSRRTARCPWTASHAARAGLSRRRQAGRCRADLHRLVSDFPQSPFSGDARRDSTRSRKRLEAGTPRQTSARQTASPGCCARAVAAKRRPNGQGDRIPISRDEIEQQLAPDRRLHLIRSIGTGPGCPASPPARRARYGGRAERSPIPRWGLASGQRYSALTSAT